MKVILLVLVCIAFIITMMPYIIRFFINRSLKKMDGYTGNVENIKLSLLRGSIEARNVRILKLDDAKSHHSFFEASQVITIIMWKHLLKKEIFGSIQLINPILNYDKTEAVEGNSTKKSFNLQQQLERLAPFKMDAEITNGVIRYKDFTSKVKVNAALTDVNLNAKSVSNIIGSDPLPAKINLNARVYEGTMSVSLNFDPMASQVKFDLNTEVKDINLVWLNDLLREYARIDVNSGRFRMVAEVAAKDGAFKGYIKPIFSDLDFVGASDRDDHLFKRLWEGFVAVVIQILKNKNTDELASKISISGDFERPHVNILSAVLNILRNAFIHSLTPSLEDIIDVNSVKDKLSRSTKTLRRLLGKNDADSTDDQTDS